MLLFLVLTLNVCVLKKYTDLFLKCFSLFLTLCKRYQRVYILFWLVYFSWFLRFIYVDVFNYIVHGIFSFVFYSVIPIYHNLSTYSPVSGSLGFLAAINNAAMNIYGHVSFCTCGYFFRMCRITDEWNSVRRYVQLY